MTEHYWDYRKEVRYLEFEELLKLCIQDYKADLPKHQQMHDYYIGKTDAMKNYKMVTNRTNNKINCNFIKKFIKEEVAYALGNKLTYISRTGSEDIIKAVTTNLAHWSEKHDQNLLKNALKQGIAYELYYIDKDGLFSATILTPLNAYVYENEDGEVQFLLHFFNKKFEDKQYMDVYLPNKIIHYVISGDDNLTVIGEDSHIFNEVPVGLCPISEEKELDTLFSDLKGLQDAYETNLSDISNEIADWRQAYLKIIGGEISEEDLAKMKQLGAIQIPSDGDSKIDVDWLIKNINDNFVKNTLDTIEDKIYQLSCHINANEKLSSNTSSLALRTRLISLENKVKLSFDAVADCIKTRLKFLFKYLAIKQGTLFDYRDVKVKFTPLIPSDDLVTAQIISQLGDKISTQTGIAQLSFIENPAEEMERIKKEREELEELDLMKIDPYGDE